MSELDDRYGTTYGSTGATGRPLPGQPFEHPMAEHRLAEQPLAEQPTQVVPPVGPDWRQDTVAVPPPPPVQERSDDPLDDIAEWEDDGTATQPAHRDHRDTPVPVRRADDVAGLLLLLAGIAAGVSLLLVWVHGGATGLELVRDGLDDLDRGAQRLVDRDTWQPLAVVSGGVALFVLGLLVFVPARTHRFLGALALLVSLVVAAGVLVPLADRDWDVQRWAVGGWFTVAVGALGFLGALKALMTGPRCRG
jgi:hypothetical protein